MTVLGDFHAGKVHVREEMNRRIDSLLSDLILAPSTKEYDFKTSIVSVFRYSAGFEIRAIGNEQLEIKFNKCNVAVYILVFGGAGSRRVELMLRLFWSLAQKGVGIARLQS